MAAVDEARPDRRSLDVAVAVLFRGLARLRRMEGGGGMHPADAPRTRLGRRRLGLRQPIECEVESGA